MIVLGIDPGFAITGYAVIGDRGNGFMLYESGVVRTKPRDGFSYRLLKIYNRLIEIHRAYSVNVMACEQLFFNRNVRTAINVAQARGVVVLFSAIHNIGFSEYAPLEIKRAVTGDGGADKHQVKRMVRMLLNLKEEPKVDDEADAMAIAICHLINKGRNHIY